MLKKVNAIMLGLVVLLAFGCGSDEAKQGIPAVAKKDCQLIKSTVYSKGGPGNQYSTIEFNLNSKGQAIESIYKSSKDGITYQTIERKAFFHNSLGKLNKIISYPFTDTVPIYFENFHYNAGNQLSSIETYNINNWGNPVDTVLSKVESFEYYPNNQVKRHYFSSSLDVYHEYSYPNKNKAIRRSVYWDATANQLKIQQIDEIEFDSKRSINIFPYSRISLAYIIGVNGGLDFGHNVVSLKTTNYSFNAKFSTYRTYQYNSNDYPTSWAISDSLGNVGSYGTYDYSCQ